MMQLGNHIEFTKDFDKAKRLFKVLSEDKFKMADIRSAYWCWMKEQYTSAQHDGTSIDDLHKRYKISYLLPILCIKDTDFADMILLIEQADYDIEEKEQKVNKILSIADSSITGFKEMSRYFNACKENEQYN